MMNTYWQASRAPRYSLLFALPLLIIYQILAALVPALPDRGRCLDDRQRRTLSPREANPLRSRRDAARVRLPGARVRRRRRQPHRGAARHAPTLDGPRGRVQGTAIDPLDTADALARRRHL